MSLRPGLLVMSALLLACSPAPTVREAPATSTSRSPAGVAKAPRVPVAGQLRIPAVLTLGAGVKLISDRGAGLISSNGAGLIADRGAGFISDDRARVGGSVAGQLRARTGYALQAIEDAGVEGARVFLADAAGHPLPQLQAGKTDAQSRFTLPEVPVDSSFLIVAEVPTRSGQVAVFRTLVKVGRYGATTIITPASTLVTASVLDGLPRGDLGDFNPARFQTASEAAARSLTPQNLPDFTDALAVKARIDALEREVDELKDTLAAVRAELAALRDSVEALSSPGPAATGQGPRETPTPLPTKPPVQLPPGPVVTLPSPSGAPLPGVAPSPSRTPTPVGPSALPTGLLGCGPSTYRKFTLPETRTTAFVTVKVKNSNATIGSARVEGGAIGVVVPTGCALVFTAYTADETVVDVEEVLIPVGAPNEPMPLDLEDPDDDKDDDRRG